MHVGMTGTRSGMTIPQMAKFRELLGRMGATKLHHGDCIGADAEAHGIAHSIRIPSIIHPPIKSALRALMISNDIREPKNYFARNRDIVSDSKVLIGTPVTDFETDGGTWYTINYAKKQGKPVRIIYPDGSVEKFN